MRGTAARALCPGFDEIRLSCTKLNFCLTGNGRRSGMIVIRAGKRAIA